ncbi:MAG: DNA double-strand break repair nuclease NurA, partial [Candidatus Bathyarchaeia archaeon]
QIGIIKKVKEDISLTEAFRKALAIGVDSSRQAPLRVLSLNYCPITSAIVYFEGISGKVIYDPDCPCKLYEEPNATPEEFSQKIREEMYRCEVSALERVSSTLQSIGGKQKILLMIDGPIIDPPDDSLYKGYVKERSNAILACIENNAMVIGCVKRLEGHHFINFLRKNKELAELASMAEGFGPDPQLVPFVFSSVRSKGIALQTMPIEILDPEWLIKEYDDAGLKKVYRIFLTLGERGTPFGVDFLVRENEDPNYVGEQVCAAVRAWGVPGLNAPLPVLAAHRRCNIKKGAAEYLYRQLLTRALSWEGGADILEPVTGGHT